MNGARGILVEILIITKDYPRFTLIDPADLFVVRSLILPLLVMHARTCLSTSADWLVNLLDIFFLGLSKLFLY